MYTMEKIVPLVGPSVVGALGIKHLPRMWQKGVLSAAGLLWDGYFDNYKGFNQRVCDAIGLEAEPWFAFLKTMPTYPQAEAYVSANARTLNAESIATLNTLIATFPRPEENAAAVRERVGLGDGTFNISSKLIDVDDWHTIHEELLAHSNDGIEPLIPMVSSAEAGPAGIPHLPRLWMKALLHAVGALHPEWKTGTNCGFDKRLATALGLDLEAATAYINSERPSFLAFERWVCDQVGTPDAATTADLAATFAAMQKPEDMAAAELAECGCPELDVRGTILLNDMIDWKYLHAYAVARKPAVPA